MTRDIVIKMGDLIDLYDDGGLVCAVVTGEEKGRLKVVTEGGKELRVTSSRVAHRAGSAAVSAGPQAAAAALRHAQAALGRVSEIDLCAMWDVLVDEPQRYALGSLAALALGADTAVTRSAMLRALQGDRTYFTRKQNDFEPRPREQVEETHRREVAERARAERREAFIGRARAALKVGAAPSPVPYPAPEGAAHRELIADLVELAIMGDEASSRKDAVALLDEAGVSDGGTAERAFRLLRAIGIFSLDENLFIHRFHLRKAFPQDVLLSAERGAARRVDVEARRDLRHLIAFTIDDDLTTEMDDALTIEPRDESRDSGVVLGVHIADPDCFVPAGDPVDIEAMSRAATFYFPEVKLPMLPPAVGEVAASLVPQQDRPALSFLITLSPLGELLSSEIVSSMIRSRARVTYEQADGLCNPSGDPLGDTGGTTGHIDATIRDAMGRALSRLRPICEALERQRVESGAVIIRAAEADIRVTASGEVQVRRIDDRGASRRMVSEAMILANRLAAEFCMQRNIPAIYRRQAPPQEALAAAGIEGGGGYDPVAVRLLRRRMRRGETSLSPAPHSGLGLPAYTQATSPIRRYQDLIVHRQIKAALAGAQPPYDAEALGRIAATTDEAERAAREAERGTDEYWILRYYESRIGQEIEGVIVAVDARRTEIELTDTLYNVTLAPRPDHRPGRKVRLVIETSRPRAGRLTLRETEA